MQRRAIRIVYQSDYYGPTNALFILHALKFSDLFHLKTAQIMYKAQNRIKGNRYAYKGKDNIYIKN